VSMPLVSPTTQRSQASCPWRLSESGGRQRALQHQVPPGERQGEGQEPEVHHAVIAAEA